MFLPFDKLEKIYVYRITISFKPQLPNFSEDLNQVNKMTQYLIILRTWSRGPPSNSCTYCGRRRKRSDKSARIATGSTWLPNYSTSSGSSRPAARARNTYRSGRSLACQDRQWAVPNFEGWGNIQCNGQSKSSYNEFASHASSLY